MFREFFFVAGQLVVAVLLLPTSLSNFPNVSESSNVYLLYVLEYELLYKLQNEPDSAYLRTPVQPVPGNLSATIRNLEPGQSYTIRLRAFHSGKLA